MTTDSNKVVGGTPKNVVVIVSGTVVTVVVSIIGALTALGVDTTDFRGVLNSILNFGGLVLGTVSAIYAGTAAKKSTEAAQQTNGGLESRVANIVQAELKRGNYDGR